jgi:hypothetical protein
MLEALKNRIRNLGSVLINALSSFKPCGSAALVPEEQISEALIECVGLLDERIGLSATGEISGGKATGQRDKYRRSNGYNLLVFRSRGGLH